MKAALGMCQVLASLAIQSAAYCLIVANMPAVSAGADDLLGRGRSFSLLGLQDMIRWWHCSFRGGSNVDGAWHGSAIHGACKIEAVAVAGVPFGTDWSG